MSDNFLLDLLKIGLSIAAIPVFYLFGFGGPILGAVSLFRSRLWKEPREFAILLMCLLGVGLVTLLISIQFNASGVIQGSPTVHGLYLKLLVLMGLNLGLIILSVVAKKRYHSTSQALYRSLEIAALLSLALPAAFWFNLLI